jgi:hypothetical protein
MRWEANCEKVRVTVRGSCPVLLECGTGCVPVESGRAESGTAASAGMTSVIALRAHRSSALYDMDVFKDLRLLFLYFRFCSKLVVLS